MLQAGGQFDNHHMAIDQEPSMRRVAGARARRCSGRALLTIATGLVALVAASCGGDERQATPTTEPDGPTTSATEPAGFAERFARYEPAPEPNGDLSKVVWPAYVLNAPPEVKELYEFQVTHGDLMRWMPCSCGCGQTAGHRSNRDCYIRRVNADGSVVFDPMAPT
jgi:uncharacterized protein with PCYCGC motif